MGLALFQERRLETRRKLTGLLPGRLKTSNGSDIECRPIDVSEHGLGIVSKEPLKMDSMLELQIKDKKIILKVAWVQPGFSKREVQRYGLVAQDVSLNLEAIFLSAGCLK